MPPSGTNNTRSICAISVCESARSHSPIAKLLPHGTNSQGRFRIYQTSVNFNAPFQFSADLPYEEVILFPQLVICRGVRNRNLRSVRCHTLFGPKEPHLRHKPAHQHTNQTTEENLCHFLQPAPNSSCGGGADTAGGDNQGR